MKLLCWQLFKLRPYYFFRRFKGNQLCAIKIEGSAFLCHQVCCMVAVLLMIGQALESPDLTSLREFLKFHPFTLEILKARQVNRCITGHSKDTKETPVSHGSRNSIGSSSCEFEALKFACSSGVTEFVHRCWTSSAWSLGE